MKTEVQQFRLFSVPIEATDLSTEEFNFLASDNNMTEQNSENHSNQLVVINSGSEPNRHVSDQDCAVSDSESSCVSVSSNEINPKPELLADDLIRIQEQNLLHQTIKQRILAGLSAFGLQTRIEAIHKNAYSGFRKQAKFQSFQIFKKAMEQNYGGNANVKFAWFGASKEQVVKIISHGFDSPPSNGMYGRGVYFSPVEYPLDSLQSTLVDEDGLRHLILCRVLMGRMERVQPGSEQTHPSSEDFDSGVDNLASPRKYIVWGTHMNTHILPEFVISIRTNSRQECQRISNPQKKPNSPWMPFPTLISQLAKVLPPHSINLIKKYHIDHKERKMTRNELIQKVRHIAGDKLLAAVIKSYRGKQLNSSTNCACWKKA